MNKSTFLALPTGIAIVVAGTFLGCAGRTDVTSGSDAAQNLPAKPHATPQLRPGASKLPSVGESAKHPHDQHKEHASTSPTTATMMPRVPPPDPSKAQVLKGFKVEVVMSGLTYATSVEFDGEGNLYVAEAGYSYGAPSAKPRVLRVTSSGEISTVAASGLEGPVNDLLWHDGRMYVAHRGKISVLDHAKLRDVVTGLPSEGDHHTNQMTVGPDGKIYVGQGTATNSGVVGIDNFKMGWLKKHPDFHDVPAKEVKLVGRTYPTTNPLTQKQEKVQTSAFHPFTEAAPEGSTVEGRTKASGTILRMNADGSELEVYAWGLRNPFGLMWAPDGKLYTTENGLDVRGSRPVANDKEDIYVVERGAWYGWPDYAIGLPVTDERFKPEGKPQPRFVMANHPRSRNPGSISRSTLPSPSSISAPLMRSARGRCSSPFSGT